LWLYGGCSISLNVVQQAAAQCIFKTLSRREKNRMMGLPLTSNAKTFCGEVPNHSLSECPYKPDVVKSTL
jgi:hypothetical protein